MKVWLILPLFLVLMVDSIKGADCGQTAKCTKAKGICQPKGDECSGDIFKGKKYCKKFKTCQCCVKKDDNDCGQTSKCTKAKGICQPKGDECIGDIFKGKKYCKKYKTCQCCVKKEECGKPKKCNAKGGVCQDSGDKCKGTLLGGNKLCGSKKCKCCIADPVCDPKCDNGGTCVAPNTCACTENWTGPTCQIPVCDPVCENGGICSAPNTCTCKEGWTGPTCSIPVCDPACENGGTCSAPDTCTCTVEWTGPTCEIPVCDPMCANGGTCTAPNTCACVEGWTGPTCETPICDSPCLNGGTCIAPNTCECVDFWGGPTCEIVDSAKCSLSLTASDGMSTTWESPGYDGSSQTYPDDDYCCWANITIPDTYDMFMVSMTTSSTAMIYETGQCVGDRLTYYSSSDTTTTICGDLGSQTWTETAVHTAPLSFGFQWCSDKSDGGTDLGFKLYIIGTNLQG